MASLANNVIQFPSRGNFDRAPAPQSLDEVIEMVDDLKQAHIQETIETVIPMLFNSLSVVGFQPDDDDTYLKDGALIVEAVRSFLNKTYSIEHPLQFIAEHMFEQSEEDGHLSVSNRVKLVITPAEGQS